MNRRILLQLTVPTVRIGTVLFGACIASVWSINRLQANLAQILSENVAKLEAAQELEIQMRQLRFHSFLLIIDPNDERRVRVAEDHTGFEQAIEQVRERATQSAEQELVRQIEEGYQRYRTELSGGDVPTDPRALDLAKWADRHPIRHLQRPCHELLRLNKQEMD